MKSEDELKQHLIEIRDNEWRIPQNVDNYEFAAELLSHIGSTDPELRDLLILEILYRMITEEDLTDGEVKRLADLMLSEKHLFYRIEERDGDSVFNRAFTVLLMAGVIYRHNNNKKRVYTEDEIKNIYQKLTLYAKKEKDVRGYVQGKGWAHSAAHCSDALREIALCKELSKVELMGILNTVKEKICINYYTYVNNEDERLVSPVINVIERGVIDQDEIIAWIKGFEHLEKCGDLSIDHILMSNHKNFLASLYFRMKRRHMNVGFLNAIEQVLESVTPNCFK